MDSEYKVGYKDGQKEARTSWKDFLEDPVDNNEIFSVAVRRGTIMVVYGPAGRDHEADEAPWNQGFHKGYADEIKRLVMKFIPKRIAKYAPHICVLVENAERLQYWPVFKEITGYRPKQASLGNEHPSVEKMAAVDARIDADGDWKNFLDTADISNLHIYDTQDEAGNAAQNRWKEIPEDQVDSFMTRWEEVYIKELREKIDSLLPSKLRKWAWHYCLLFGALGLAKPVPAFQWSRGFPQELTE